MKTMSLFLVVFMLLISSVQPVYAAVDKAETSGSTLSKVDSEDMGLEAGEEASDIKMTAGEQLKEDAMAHLNSDEDWMPLQSEDETKE